MRNSFFPKIVIFFFIFFILSVLTFAEKNNWVSIGVIGNELWFVDIDSISCEANSCKVWIKMLSRTSAKRLPLEGEGYIKSLFDYNCTWMEYRILETIEYDSSGHVIRSVLPKDQNKKFKIQEPVNKQFHDLVCQRINVKKEEKKQIQAHEEKKFPDKKIPPKKVISSKPPITLKTYFTVQIGAFENISYAKTLKKTFNKKGYHTHIIRTKKKGNLYKVCIGKFSDRKKAHALAEKIKKTEGFQAFVTIW
jgi:hypothetical protein